jgi:carbonic anhydrase/acetyltransferase-like protein (isoleucine patch superfamily)
MNAVVMDNVVVGEGCIVGALAFLPEGMKVEPRKVVVGNPARVVKDVSDEMLEWKTEGTGWYRRLPDQMKSTWKECEPLREVPDHWDDRRKQYKNWKSLKKD